MSTIMNILWFLFGGVFMGIGWVLAGLLMFVSIIGIPWGRACFVIAGFSFFPFGRTIIRRDRLTGHEDIGTSPLGFVGNVIWFVFFGLWLAVGHFVSAVACFITIILIPFGIQHMKLAAISMAPIGMTVVPNEVAEAARAR
ncbi:YccF domain-containing protein [Pseudodesulfovibrio senegalensis]|uniref:YccF domain-containing protein n=1 Tax=Pseudodesulfovibrio senegalensis TaxID=1721087 RepID=A0A6N6N6D2_9BACT|nr:YccF domain-containing protein [Pseudodesulfovibrio senegalensis]KAB1442446.1 YccF domain-containing protein [Pseudodesulfovibrio senegalensis]